MKLKQTTVLLIVLLIFVLLAKLIVLSDIDSPAYDSYYGMRQVENIKSTGVPIVNDNLSYQGRTNTLDFFVYYILAFFSVFVPIKLLFLFGGVLVGLGSLVLIFLIARKLYANRWVALIVTVLGALSTVIFSSSLATLTSSSLFLLVYLGMIYAFISFSRNENQIVWFLILAVVGTLLSSLMLPLVLAFVIYFLLVKLENLKTRYKEVELVGFTGLFVIWYHLILYRSLFELHGSRVLWDSVPRELLSVFFQKLSLPLMVALIGVLPFILGLYAIYHSLFTQRRRYLLFVTSLALSFIGLLFMGFLPVLDGLLFTTVSFILLSGFAIKQLNAYFNKMNFARVKYFLVALLIVLSLVNFVPIIISGSQIQSPSIDETEFLESLSLPKDATIFANIQEGQFISYYAGEKTFYDERFTLAPQPQRRYEDAQTIFLSTSKTKTLSLLNYYDIHYVYLSQLTRSEYNVSTYLFENDPCFKLVGQSEQSQLYEVRCTLSK